MAGWRQVTFGICILKIISFFLLLLYLEDCVPFIMSHKRILSFPVLDDVASFAQITELGFNAIKMEYMSTSVSC